jgi:uncharacterized protein YajQ (UPF0234 family)
MSLTFADTLRKEITDREEEITNIISSEEKMYNYVTEVIWKKFITRELRKKFITRELRKKFITRELRKSKTYSIKFNLYEQGYSSTY